MTLYMHKNFVDCIEAAADQRKLTAPTTAALRQASRTRLPCSPPARFQWSCARCRDRCAIGGAAGSRPSQPVFSVDPLPAHPPVPTNAAYTRCSWCRCMEWRCCWRPRATCWRAATPRVRPGRIAAGPPDNCSTPLREEGVAEGTCFHIRLAGCTLLLLFSGELSPWL